jgi:hypothetical protein
MAYEPRGAVDDSNVQEKPVAKNVRSWLDSLSFLFNITEISFSEDPRGSLLRNFDTYLPDLTKSQHRWH